MTTAAYAVSCLGRLWFALGLAVAPLASADRHHADTRAASPEMVTVPYDVELAGRLNSVYLGEASGLARSTRRSDVVWSHNDSGHGPYLFAFGVSGEPRGRFFVEGAAARDWEDLASFSWNDQSWLLIADAGDNKSVKTHYVLYLVPEPEVADSASHTLRPVRGAQKVRFTLPGGPADTEAVAVDPVEERVYLMTKRKRPVEVSSLPLSAFARPAQTLVARAEATLFPIPPPSLQDLIDYPKLGIALSQPTAMDFAPDRSFAVVHTYRDAYRFDRGAKQSWAEAFATAPARIVVPRMQQSEAVAVGWDSRSMYFTSEGRKPPLYRLQPSPDPATPSLSETSP